MTDSYGRRHREVTTFLTVYLLIFRNHSCECAQVCHGSVVCNSRRRVAEWQLSLPLAKSVGIRFAIRSICTFVFTGAHCLTGHAKNAVPAGQLQIDVDGATVRARGAAAGEQLPGLPFILFLTTSGAAKEKPNTNRASTLQLYVDLPGSPGVQELAIMHSSARRSTQACRV